MKAAACIGSSCRIKGSRPVVERLRELIAGDSLTDRIELSGSFRKGQCRQGVCITVDGGFFSVSPRDGFFLL